MVIDNIKTTWRNLKTDLFLELKPKKKKKLKIPKQKELSAIDNGYVGDKCSKA